MYLQYLEIIWIIIICIALYPFTLYPLIIRMMKEKKYTTDPNYLPSVSFIISAYNEESNIEKKIKNTLELDYPHNLLEIIVASDGSTDSTINLSNQFNDIKTLDLKRSGKTAIQNEAAEQSNGEILIFSDANSIYDKNAIKQIVLPFSDEKIGCVCGQLVYNTKGEESTYWTFEKFLKIHEGKRGKLMGANGGIYAVKSTLYAELDPLAISDMIEPIKIIEKGYDVVYQEKAKAFENEPKSIFARKRRIILRSLQSLSLIRRQLLPFSSSSIFFYFFPHKILRWILPVMLLSQFFLLIVLRDNSIYRNILFFELFFIFSSLFFNPIKYFIHTNMAALIAIKDYLLNKQIIVWETQRTNE